MSKATESISSPVWELMMTKFKPREFWDSSCPFTFMDEMFPSCKGAPSLLIVKLPLVYSQIARWSFLQDSQTSFPFDIIAEYPYQCLSVRLVFKPR